MIPREHPRYESLKLREKVVEGYREGLTALEGLIAHGRGEAFDYLIGERTVAPAKEAIEAGGALLALAEAPVISVNGNTASLCAKEMVELSLALEAKLEVNLFYYSEERVAKIKEKLHAQGAKEVLVERELEIPGLASQRRKVSREGIYSGDVVLVALEDGDRTEALIEQGKKVVAVDLNPLSRTARKATVAIVDDVVRSIPSLRERAEYFRANQGEAGEALNGYNRDENLREVLRCIAEYLEEGAI